MLDDVRYSVSTLWNAAREYGLLRSSVDAWHVLRFETKDEGGPVAWTRSVMKALSKEGGSVPLKVAYLAFMYGTPYCVSAMLASKLPDSWLRRCHLSEKQPATELARSRATKALDSMLPLD